MIIVKAVKDGNVFCPAEDYPKGTSKVVFNGTDYLCYDAEEAAVMDKAAAEAAAEELAQGE